VLEGRDSTAARAGEIESDHLGDRVPFDGEGQTVDEPLVSRAYGVRRDTQQASGAAQFVAVELANSSNAEWIRANTMA
jgi:hypothetical protein